jgi:hypothetical protein
VTSFVSRAKCDMSFHLGRTPNTPQGALCFIPTIQERRKVTVKNRDREQKFLVVLISFTLIRIKKRLSPGSDSRLELQRGLRCCPMKRVKDTGFHFDRDFNKVRMMNRRRNKLTLRKDYDLPDAEIPLTISGKISQSRHTYNSVDLSRLCFEY